jgi:hypothetical protein
MDQLYVHTLIENSNQVRREWYDGEFHYNVIDFIAELTNVDYKHAQNYYHVLKARLQKDNRAFPVIKKLKVVASDKKRYFTSFTNVVGLELLYQYIQPNQEAQQIRSQVSKRDEVINFHPKVITYLEQKGWCVQQHVSLPSGGVIDLVAESENTLYVIECKPILTRSKFYSAIGQVLCYRQEYHPQSTAAIAAYRGGIDEYVRQYCNLLGIEVIEIED